MNETKQTNESEEFEEINLDAQANVLTDDNISQEQINEMKMLGLPKPDTVSWERWQRIQSIRTEHELMIKMAATGSSQKVIAETLGYTNAQVSKILATPDVKQKISEEISSIYGDDIKKALKSRAVKSIEVFDDIIATGKNSERLQAAQYILDHTVGKAQQTVEHKGTILSDVMIHIDKLQTQLRDVSPEQALLTKKPHKFDTVIEQIVPTGVVVGKRTNEEQGE